jgi:hypothetical protein
VTDGIGAAAEQRWTAWKIEGARLDVVRADRMRQLFVAAGLAPMLWLLWRL